MSPQKYLIVVALTGLLLGILHLQLFLYQLGAPIQAEYWLYELATVKQYRATLPKTPKLVILGGSNALFGIDTALLERTLGIPSVNLALQGGLSIDYVIHEAREILQPHDHVLLAIEYDRYAREEPYDLWFTNQIMTWGTTYFWDLPLKERATFIRSVPFNRLIAGVLAQSLRAHFAAFKQRSLASPEDIFDRHTNALQETAISPQDMYSLRNIDFRGDARSIKSLWREDYEHKDYELARPFILVPRIWQELRSFSEFCQDRGITIYIAWPPTMKNDKLNFDSPVTQQHLRKLETQWSLLQIPQLGRPQEYSYDRVLFGDTVYHLTHAGRSLHTEAILRYLRPLFSSPSQG